MADDDYETLLFSQRLEFMAASTAESDLDLAFNLQLQEVMAASLAHQPSSSSSPPPPPSSLSPPEDDASLITLQTLELNRFHQEKHDAQISKIEMDRITADLRRRAHDDQFAREIDQMPDDDWEDFGDEVEKPMEKGDEKPLRVYFKGMESTEVVKGKLVRLAGIGAAVCDHRDRLLLKISKPLVGAGTCREALEAKALIEGLNAVIELGANKVDVLMDYRTLYNHVTGRWIVKQSKVKNLINQILLLDRGLDCNLSLVPRCQIKYAFQLVRDAIDSQLTRDIDLSDTKDVKEACKICLEDTELSQMFVVDECFHRYCFSCMKQHVEVKLLHGMLPGCPYDGCKNKLKVENCRRFLTPKLLNIMSQRIKEESIPVTQKIYCPYPKCSALMSLSEAIRPLQEPSSKLPIYGTSGLRKCIQCSGPFCIKCKVPWHDRMSCYDYKRLNPQNHAEESKLKDLARQKLWRQCVKCNHMIELAEGCYHMTCRCGYEFCYTCGAEWRDKKATCSCPLFNYADSDDADDYFEYDDDEEEEEEEEEEYEFEYFNGHHVYY